MKVLSKGEHPNVGDEVEVIYRGKVSVAETHSNQFKIDIIRDSGPEAIFSYNRISEIRVTKPARNWVKYGIYVDGRGDGPKITAWSLWRRESGGWTNLGAMDIMFDGDESLTEEFLDGLVHLSKDK